ncbi:MAG: hypothetical protein LBQ13_02895 [Endomicrobium sp.]|jgi:hypothetical protein|nr:hypothetical protein [Endomicrobium sp.]
MAEFKSLRQKEKIYIFKVFDNEKSDNPAKVVFHRFPLSDELFPLASQKNVLESTFVKEFDNTPEAKEKLVRHIIDVMIDNMTANRFDYINFIKECVDHFENFTNDGKEIVTVDDFLTLPPEAVQKIAKDLYFYSKIEDEFTFNEKKI